MPGPRARGRRRGRVRRCGGGGGQPDERSGPPRGRPPSSPGTACSGPAARSTCRRRRQLQAAGRRRHGQRHQPLVHVVRVGGRARRHQDGLGDVGVRGADGERRAVGHRARGRGDPRPGALEQVGRREDLDLVALAAEVRRPVVPRRDDAPVGEEQRRRVVPALLGLGRERRPGVRGRVVAQRLLLGGDVVLLEVAPDRDDGAVRGQDRVGVAARLRQRSTPRPPGGEVRRRR